MKGREDSRMMSMFFWPEQWKDGVSHLLRQENLWMEQACMEKNQFTVKHCKFELAMACISGEVK